MRRKETLNQNGVVLCHLDYYIYKKNFAAGPGK